MQDTGNLEDILHIAPYNRNHYSQTCHRKKFAHLLDIIYTIHGWGKQTFSLLMPGKTLPQILIITPYIRQKEINHTYPPGNRSLENLFLQQEGAKAAGEWVFTLPIITISPFYL